MEKTLNAIIKGRVQGVGFRYFTKNKAKELHLRGWVRNLPDGSVETQASGPAEALERLLQSLSTGPVGSQVDSVEVQWLPAPEGSQGFEVRF